MIIKKEWTSDYVYAKLSVPYKTTRIYHKMYLLFGLIPIYYSTKEITS